MAGQLFNVPASFPQRRQVELQGVQAIEEVLPEGVICKHFLNQGYRREKIGEPGAALFHVTAFKVCLHKLGNNRPVKTKVPLKTFILHLIS